MPLLKGLNGYLSHKDLKLTCSAMDCHEMCVRGSRSTTLASKEGNYIQFSGDNCTYTSPAILPADDRNHLDVKRSDRLYGYRVIQVDSRCLRLNRDLSFEWIGKSTLNLDPATSLELFRWEDATAENEQPAEQMKRELEAEQKRVLEMKRERDELSEKLTAVTSERDALAKKHAETLTNAATTGDGPRRAHQTLYEAKVALKDNITGVSKALTAIVGCAELKNSFNEEVEQVCQLREMLAQSQDALWMCWSAMASSKAMPFTGFEVTRDIGHAGLSANQAVELVKRYVQNLPTVLKAAAQLQSPFKLNFIVGRGNGSGPTGPVVGPAVRKYLQDSGIEFVEDQASKGGMISIVVKAGDGPSCDDQQSIIDEINRAFDL